MRRPRAEPQKIEPDDALHRHLVQSQQGLKKMAALVDRFGIEICLWALKQICDERVEEKRRGTSRPGRKKDFDADLLRNIWVFVESRRKKQSVNAFCKTATFESVEFDGNGKMITKMVAGATLRRRYQEAVRYLRKASAPYKEFARRGFRSTHMPLISPEEMFWRRLLAEEIDRLSGKAR